MRTLVCILAQPREHAVVWNSFKTNVLDPLEADLALSISAQEDSTNPFLQNAKYKWVTPEYDNWLDAFEYAKETDFQEYTNDWKYQLVNDDCNANWLSPINNALGAGAILIFYRWFLLHNLKKENLIDQYDRFIVTRSDYLYLMRHPPLELLDSTRVWVPDGAYHGGITDRYAILSRQNIEAYLSILKHVFNGNLYPRVMQHEYKNLEAAVKNTLDIENVEIGTFPFFMYSVRSKGTPTRWEEGTWSDELGYYIKYMEEYEQAHKNVLESN